MYYTGSVNSYADLRTAIFNACTTNGWTLTSDVLSKGLAFVKITVSTAVSGNPGPGLIMQGYTSSALANPSPIRPRLGLTSYLSPAISFPVQYFIHIFDSPDEVFVIVKTGVDNFYFLSFGLSDTPGITGTGLFLAATSPYNMGGNPGVFIGPDASSGTSGAFFWQSGPIGDLGNQTMQVGLDGFVWSTPANRNVPGSINASLSARPMINYSPNGWNSASPLIRIRGLLVRDSSKTSLVFDIKNARYIRVSNFEPGEIFTLGAEQWVVYPWYKKDASVPNASGAGGNSPTSHSGTLGWAIRYDGP